MDQKHSHAQKPTTTQPAQRHVTVSLPTPRPRRRRRRRRTPRLARRPIPCPSSHPPVSFPLHFFPPPNPSVRRRRGADRSVVVVGDGGSCGGGGGGGVGVLLGAGIRGGAAFVVPRRNVLRGFPAC